MLLERTLTLARQLLFILLHLSFRLLHLLDTRHTLGVTTASPLAGSMAPCHGLLNHMTYRIT